MRTDRFKRLMNLLQRLDAKQVSDQEAANSLIVILTELEADQAKIQADMDEQERQMEQLRDLGIVEMMAARFIFQEGLQEEFNAFLETELLKAAQEKPEAHIH